MMRPHCCGLQYMATGRNNFHLGVSSCSVCQSNLSFLKDEHSPQLTKSFPRSAPVKLRTFGLVSTNRVIVSELNPSKPEAFKTELNNREEKLQTILSELKVSELKINNTTKQKLIKIVSENLNAFAASDDDLGHTTVCQHKINTGDKPPFRERLEISPGPAESM